MTDLAELNDNSDPDVDSSGYWTEPPPDDLRFHSDSSHSSTTSDSDLSTERQLDPQQTQRLKELQALFPWDNKEKTIKIEIWQKT